MKQLKSYVLELKDAYLKMLIFFFSFPNKIIGLNDLSTELSIAKTTARTVINQLVEEGFLTCENIGRILRITCNHNHKYNYIRKVAHNITCIYESNIIDEILKLYPGAKSITLFGSYRKGDDIESSDIDIAVEIVGNHPPKIIELGLLPQHGYRKNISVTLHIFSRNNIDINLFSNIANGIVLTGFLEVKP